jgi:hypothetical protein
VRRQPTGSSRYPEPLALEPSRVSDLTRISIALDVDEVIEARQRQSITDV